MFRLVQPFGIGSRSGGGTAAFNPASVSGYTRDWNFADATKLYTDVAHTTLVTADADPIGAVADTSSSGIYLLASADDNTRPFYKTAIQNGLSVGRCDGSNDKMAGAITADASQTIYVVVKKRGAVSASSLTALSFDNSGAQFYTNSGAPSATGWNYYASQASAEVAVGGTPTNWNIITFCLTSAANLKIYVNGGAAAASFDPNDAISSSTLLNVGYATAGLGQHSDIDVGRILVYSATHSTTEMDTVLSGLGSLWNISVTATS